MAEKRGTEPSHFEEKSGARVALGKTRHSIVSMPSEQREARVHGPQRTRRSRNSAQKMPPGIRRQNLEARSLRWHLDTDLCDSAHEETTVHAVRLISEQAPIRLYIDPPDC